MIKKKIWYGGRVTAVSKKGSKIKIKYDDGTTEISKFPDKDVVVDAAMNGEHSVPADRFIPPAPEDDLQDDTRSTGMEEADGDHAVDVEEPESPNLGVSVQPNDGETVQGVKSAEMASSREKEQPASTFLAPVEVEPKMKATWRPSSPTESQLRNVTASPARDGEVIPQSETKGGGHEEGEIDVASSNQSDPMTPVPLVPSKEKDSDAAGVSKHPEEVARAPSEPSTVTTVPLLATPEEGELSPGITVQKRSVLEVVPFRQSPSSDQLSKPEPSVESKIAVEDQTSNAGLYAKESLSSTPVQQDEEAKTVVEDAFATAVAKPKLAIRISNVSATMMKSSPQSLPPVDKDVSVDEVLVDTPVMEEISKRKRAAHPDGDDEAPPPKRRIRVSIGKLEEKLAKDTASVRSEGISFEVTEEDKTPPGDREEVPPLATTAKTLVEHSKETGEPKAIDKAAPAATGGKKKKKKTDYTKGPSTKSPLPKRAASPVVMTTQLSGSQKGEFSQEGDSDRNVARPIASEPGDALGQGASMDVAGNPQFGTRISASTSKKSSQPGKGALDATGNTPKQTSLKSQSSMESLGSAAAARTGRKAAQEAMEKLNTKEKDVQPPLESGKKKKKRKRKEDAEVDVGGESDASNEPKWVQCDSCTKWRILPLGIGDSSLPNKWYCHMNVYDPKRSSCSAPEQSLKEALMERKKARKRAKRLERVEGESIPEDLKIEKQPIPATPVSSPKPTKVVKSVSKVKEVVENKKATPATSEDQSHVSDSGSDTQKEEKKKGKKGKISEALLAPEISEAAADSKKTGRKRGRPARNQPSSTPLTSQESRDEDNVEWVQCEKCEKWRKLPPDISADELPDTWYCSMNTWNPASASCQAAEDKTDSQHHEIGTSEWQLRQTHAGKYSYRQLIFGTGARKHNRPMSERSRAAESLFMRHSDDDENPHPTVMYSKSSCFLPRTSNFHKANALEDSALGIFDVLSDSNLWAELRRTDAAATKVESSSAGQSSKFVSYDNLPDYVKHAMQEVVLHILNTHSLTGDDVIGECHRYPWAANGLVEIRGYCNTDVIINTVLTLVRDGIVEMTYVSDPNVPISEWVPKYRRVRSRRALEAVEAIKASRCMKIAKPWKQREEKSSDWISGNCAFY